MFHLIQDMYVNVSVYIYIFIDTHTHIYMNVCVIRNGDSCMSHCDAARFRLTAVGGEPVA